MRFPKMTPRIERVANKYRNAVLRRLRLHGLKEGEIKLRILMELSGAGQTNVYKLWKRLHDVRYYTTVLRALAPLKLMKLVRVVPSSGTGRSERIYAITPLGELILALVKGGWRSAAQLLAEDSPSFRECVKAHFSRYPYYYWGLTRDIIEEYVKIAWKYVATDIDIASFTDVEEIVRRREIEWVKEHIVNELNDPSSRLWISKYLKKMSQVDWIWSELLSFLDDHIAQEKEWLQTLDEFKSDLVSAEKRVKLTQFFSQKKGNV